MLVVAASTVRLEYFRVSEADNTLVVQWQAIDEEPLRNYEVLRRTTSSDNQFVQVASVNPHGPARPYEFRDSQVFKSGSDDVTYRLEGILKNGQRVLLGERSVSYSPTAVRRTWGSIKAMFQ